MAYLITAYDHPNMDEKREAVRLAHREYLASFGKKLLSSGALLDETGDTIIGGASLVDFDSYQEVVRFEQDDPYAKAGIRNKVTIVPWRLRWWVGDFDGEGHTPSK